jgi:hypothetical protein
MIDTSIYLFDSRNKIPDMSQTELLKHCKECTVLINEAQNFNYLDIK